MFVIIRKGILLQNWRACKLPNLYENWFGDFFKILKVAIPRQSKAIIERVEKHKIKSTYATGNYNHTIHNEQNIVFS